MIGLDVLAEIYLAVSDTQREATRSTLMRIMQPLEKDIKAFITKKKEAQDKRYA